MKKIVIFLISILVFSLSAQADIGLYTTESLTPRKFTEIPDLLSDFIKNNPERNILFYVHGRSKTLESEWRNIKEVEDIYNVKVIMLHWDSWNYMLSRPVGNAKSASEYLSESLKEFNNFKVGHPEMFIDRKTFLLCHSMGNITFKNYIEKFDQSYLSNNLFDTLILNASDVPFTKHHKWLSKVRISPNVNVIMNQDDAVLLASTVHDFLYLNVKDDRLGLGFGIDNLLFFNNNSAPNATYYDLTRVAGTEHGHYLSTKLPVRILFHYLFMENGNVLNTSHTLNKNLIRLK